MKLIILATAITLFTTASAHSWLHCTNHNNTGIKADMAAAALATPQAPVDPLYVYTLCSHVQLKEINPLTACRVSHTYATAGRAQSRTQAIGEMKA